MQEKLSLIEEELELNRKEHSRLVQQEHDYYVIELEKMKSEHSAIMNNLIEKNNNQTREISELQVFLFCLNIFIST